MRPVTHRRLDYVPGLDLSSGRVGPAHRAFRPQPGRRAANPKETASHAHE